MDMAHFRPGVSFVAELSDSELRSISKAGHTHMNMGLARLALEYAKLTDLSGDYVAERNTEIEFGIKNLGQSSPGSNYEINAHETIVINEPFDLGEATVA